MGAVSAREQDGRRFEFGTTGYTVEDVFVLYDRASETLWYPDEELLAGIAGRRKGDSIAFVAKPAPLPLGEWLEVHPGSTVLLPDEEDFREISRPFLGVRLEDQDGAVVISAVVEESPAAEAGFLGGDVLRTFGGGEVTSRDDLHEWMLSRGAGDTVEVVIERDGNTLTLRPTLSSRLDR